VEGNNFRGESNGAFQVNNGFVESASTRHCQTKILVRSGWIGTEIECLSQYWFSLRGITIPEHRFT
jgi:hypothetical protein